MLSTKHVVLGLVIEREGYGYDLQQRITRRLGFLGLSDTAIYPLLNRLEQDGLIQERGPRPVGGTRRSPRMTYGATPEGVQEFHRWMAEPCERDVMREELHAKMVLSAPAHLPTLIELTERQEQECLAELQELTRPPLAAGTPWEQVAALLVEEARAIRLEGTIVWLQRARAVMVRCLREAEANVG